MTDDPISNDDADAVSFLDTLPAAIRNLGEESCVGWSVGERRTLARKAIEQRLAGPTGFEAQDSSPCSEELSVVEFQRPSTLLARARAKRWHSSKSIGLRDQLGQTETLTVNPINKTVYVSSSLPDRSFRFGLGLKMQPWDVVAFAWVSATEMRSICRLASCMSPIEWVVCEMKLPSGAKEIAIWRRADERFVTARCNIDLPERANWWSADDSASIECTVD